MSDAKMSRRDFLQAAAVAGAGLTILGGATLDLSADAADAIDAKWVPNICSMCVNSCGIRVKVRKTGSTTRAVKIEGNPLSPYNRGRICARGQSGLRRIYDPNRITRPLIRVEGSKRGEARFRAASWSEAYQYIDGRLRENQVMPWEISCAGGWMACAFYRPYLLAFNFAMEIPNMLGTPMQHCVMSEHLGIDSAIGTFNVHDELVADYDKARYYLAMGANSAVSAIATGRAVRFADGLRAGMKVVVVDPRMSELAAKADEWIPIKPGTDLAFVLAMLNVILRKRLYDDEFVRRYTNLPFLVTEANGTIVPLIDERRGVMKMPAAFYVYDETTRTIKPVPGFPASHNFTAADGSSITPALEVPSGLRHAGAPVRTLFEVVNERAAPYTPAWASAITDVPAGTIERIATEFGSTRPALMEPGWHDSRYAATPQFRKMTALLQGLVGGMDRDGGWVLTGSSHRLMNEFVDTLRQGRMPDSPLMLPGFFAPKAALDMKFNNPGAWTHGHPSINEAWNENEWRNGRPGIAFNLYTDSGFDEALNGTLTWDGKPYKLKALFLDQTNQVRNFPNWKQILTHPNLALVVSIEIGPSDSMPYADVILPDTAYLEKYDPVFDVAMSHDIAYTTRTPSVPPPGQVKHVLDIFAEMAQAFKVDYFGAMAQMMGWDADELKRCTANSMREGKGAAHGIQQFQLARMARRMGTSTDTLRAAFERDGVVSVERREDVLGKWAMPYHLPLATPSGRFEFYSLFFAGFLENSKIYTPCADPLFAFVPPEWKPGMEPGDALGAEDEFFIIYGKVPTESHAATMNLDLPTALSRRHVAPYYGIWMHPDRATRLRLATGDRIVLTNSRTGQAVSGDVFVTQMIRPDTLFVASNFGSEAPALRNAYGKGVPLTSLVARRYEPAAGGFRLSETTVKVTRT